MTVRRFGSYCHLLLFETNRIRQFWSKHELYRSTSTWYKGEHQI